MRLILAGIAAGLFASWTAYGMQTTSAFLTPGDSIDMFAEAMPSDSPDSRLYADGNKAIHDAKWADAVKLFDQVAVQEGEHAAAALYWKAYAQNKMGQPAVALDTCLALRMRFAKSGWVEDCGALEIEIRASKGQPVQPQPGQSDELKLLALSTLMQKDPQGARAQIEQLVQSDSSEHLKEAALFLLGESVPELRYAQVVRISRVEGDVRIARANTNEKSRKEAWESAEMNLPLAAGDSLVTGADGRAEIEFENASTLYLASNSVLTFDDLHTTSGVPHSEIELLSGTLTLHLDSLMPGEAFLLRTPSNDLLTRYPQKADMRVSSYTDGMLLVSLKGGTLNVPGGGKEVMAPGRELFFNKDHAQTAAPAKAGDFSEFDAWVADKYQARADATAESMKDAGLTRPVPGIAELQGQGRFYPCEPYGTCWEPSGGNGNAMLTGGPPQTPAPKSAPAKAPPAASSPNDFFPCVPGAGLNGQYPMRTVALDPSWYWTVCHSGWWIYQNDRYSWVAGTKMHHHPPIHWIRFGKTVAFVPLHPKDVKGQPPVNREHGFAPTKQKGGGYMLSPVKFEPTHPLEVMQAAPREFRHEISPTLAHVEAPRMEMHAIRDSVTARAGTPTTGVPLHFDHQTGGFTAPHQIASSGGNSATVFAPVGHSGGGYSGHSGGGSYGGGASAHSGGGGGGSSGGGGFHGGGTSSASSSSTISVSSSSGASSSVSSAGGSHH
jgi:hypothetical protein